MYGPNDPGTITAIVEELRKREQTLRISSTQCTTVIQSHEYASRAQFASLFADELELAAKQGPRSQGEDITWLRSELGLMTQKS